jgi:hypothetical protein
MHGQIGEMRKCRQSRGGLDFYYRTRATLIETRRGLGAVDYDLYRTHARAERSRVRREIFLSLLPWLRPLAAIALLVAAIFMLPSHDTDCPACDAPARAYRSMNSNHNANP